MGLIYVASLVAAALHALPTFLYLACNLHFVQLSG